MAWGKGCRTQELTLVTTLLDPVKYPAREVAEAYLCRWRLEWCLDDLKTTLGMDVLRCLSPEMVQKELLAFLIAHNLLRWVMAQAACGHQLWDNLVLTLADDLVPLRLGRREPRACKRRPKPYPLPAKPRRHFCEDPQFSHCK